MQCVAVSAPFRSPSAQSSHSGPPSGLPISRPGRPDALRRAAVTGPSERQEHSLKRHSRASLKAPSRGCAPARWRARAQPRDSNAEQKPGVDEAAAAAAGAAPAPESPRSGSAPGTGPASPPGASNLPLCSSELTFLDELDSGQRRALPVDASTSTQQDDSPPAEAPPESSPARSSRPRPDAEPALAAVPAAPSPSPAPPPQPPPPAPTALSPASQTVPREEQESAGEFQSLWRLAVAVAAALCVAAGAVLVQAEAGAGGGRLSGAARAAATALRGHVAPLLDVALHSSVAVQILSLVSLVGFVRYGLGPLMKFLHHRFFRDAAGVAQPWSRTILAWMIRDVYGPLEVLLLIAAGCRFIEGVIGPHILEVSAAIMTKITHPLLSLCTVMAVTLVLLNWQRRYFAELSFDLEIQGQRQQQHRMQALNKASAVAIVIVGVILGVSALGVDIQSLLTVGGIGGLAVGLAAREIVQNVFAGMMLLATDPFSAGDEVKLSTPTTKDITGEVLDVGWNRTTIRTFQRELFFIPNSVFATAVVLNVTRKGREWRVHEVVPVEATALEDLRQVVSDMRSLLKSDERVIKKLHRRVFFDQVSPSGAFNIYISCYVEAANRDAMMSIKEDLLLSFIRIVQRNGAALAIPMHGLRLSDHALSNSEGNWRLTSSPPAAPQLGIDNGSFDTTQHNTT